MGGFYGRSCIEKIKAKFGKNTKNKKDKVDLFQKKELLNKKKR